MRVPHQAAIIPMRRKALAFVYGTIPRQVSHNITLRQLSKCATQGQWQHVQVAGPPTCWCHKMRPPSLQCYKAPAMFCNACTPFQPQPFPLIINPVACAPARPSPFSQTVRTCPAARRGSEKEVRGGGGGPCVCPQRASVSFAHLSTSSSIWE